MSTTSFKVHSVETAPDGSVLERARETFGMVPNLLGVLAESPVAARAYLDLSELAEATSFSPEERHVVWFTFNSYHGCDYCMGAHTAIAGKEGVAKDQIESARRVEPYADPRLEALRVFALKVVEQRGWLEDADVESFLAAGYTRAQVLETIVLLSHKILSNYTNHLAGTPLDGAFAPVAWERPAGRASSSGGGVAAASEPQAAGAS